MTNTISTTSPEATVAPFVFDKEAYNVLVKAMKSADTTAENKATPWAQATFKALLATDDNGEASFTVSSMTAVLCAVYKPRTASGKAATTIGSLPTMANKRATDVKYCMDNIKIARPLVELFVNGLEYSSFAALVKGVKAAVKAAVVVEETPGEGEGEGEGVKPASQPAVGDMLQGMLSYIEGLSVADINANADALELIHAAITSAWTRSVPALDVAVNG